MIVTITTNFVIDERADAERLNRQIYALVAEHGKTWNLTSELRVVEEPHEEPVV